MSLSSAVDPIAPENAATGTNAPKPPVQAFRIVKALSSNVYLCLLRSSPPPSTPTVLPDYCVPEYRAFQNVPNRGLQQQLPLLDYESSGEATYQAMERNGTSELLDYSREKLAQLVVVKMSTSTETLRHETEVIESLHRGREYSTLHVGAQVLSSQHTFSPSMSYLVLRPIFGYTLAQFGLACNSDNTGGIPSWFVAHIFIGLLDAVEFLHGDDTVHEKMEAENVMLNLYPTYMHHRYRGYPDVQLVDFAVAEEATEKRKESDARAALRIMEAVIMKWSDVAPFLALTAGIGEDQLFSLLRLVRGMLANVDTFSLEEVQQQLAGRLEDMRHEGPETIPRDLVKLLHSDLVTVKELRRATQDHVVLKLDPEKMRLAGGPVQMKIGRDAGMRTNRILVIRFTTKMRDFLRVIGEEDITDMDMEG